MKIQMLKAKNKRVKSKSIASRCGSFAKNENGKNFTNAETRYRDDVKGNSKMTV